ncbi:unconventional myosin, partial [Tanacetum coccineum]
TAYVEKIYGIVRDNLKKELGSLLTLCIQAPRASTGVRRSGMSFGKVSQSSHWQGIVACLNTLLKTLKDNFVPPIIVQKIFCQVFSYINVQLFDSLLLRRECCTFSNGEYVKAGLAELELWCCQAKEEGKFYGRVMRREAHWSAGSADGQRDSDAAGFFRDRDVLCV